MLKILRLVSLILLAFLLVFGTKLFSVGTNDNVQHLLPTTSRVDLSQWFPGRSQDRVLAIIENEPLERTYYPKIYEGIMYLPVDMVQAYFDDEFYYDSIEKVLTYTTVDEVIRLRTEALTYYVNDTPLALNIPILELEEGMPYMPLDLVKKFANHSFVYDEDLYTLVVDDLSLDREYTTIDPKTESYGILRTWKDRRSPIVATLMPGEEVTIYEEDSIYFYVRTAKGQMGYIKIEDTRDRIYQAGTPKVYEVYDYASRITFEGGLNLAWHQVGHVDANKYLLDKLENVHGLHVISPTWFHIEDAEGHLTNLADLTYVRKAHQKGIQVWALFSNSFDKALTHEALSTTSRRERMIKELLAFAAIYELDGINIDFENVGKEDGENFVQFIKELTPYLKGQDLTVSVDMYVPSAWTAHYGRKEVAEVVDYIMIMAYDEHWSTSPDSGSVASIGFVEKGITDTLKEVPADKTVLGLPYYTRRWKEAQVDGALKVSSEAFGMETAYNKMIENGVTFVWDDFVKQYYGEYTLEGATYKMWLEEERSIEEKVKLLEAYDLAGVAGWKIGLEKAEIWDVLANYLD